MRLLRSTDGGMTWLALEFNTDEQDSFNGCSSPALLSAGGQVWGLIRSNHWYWSTDAGQHWTHLPLPSGIPIQQLAAMPGFSDTPALIAVTEDGQLWTLRLQ